MIWLAVPVIAVLITLLVLHRPRTEFQEVLRRERAMKALNKRYDPAKDTVLRRKEQREPGSNQVPAD